MKTIALNMLVWNEEDLLMSTLYSVMPYVQEAHIIDTGSTDRTMEILAVAQKKWPFLRYEQIDVQDLGEVWTGSGKDTMLTTLLNTMKDETTSNYILKVDSDEVWPEETMKEILATDLTEDFYSFYFRHIIGIGMLDPKWHKKLWALRLFKNAPDIHWTGRYGTETITKGTTRIPVKKGKFFTNPFLHLGEFRKEERKHTYHYGPGEDVVVPLPSKYLVYVPYNC